MESPNRQAVKLLREQRKRRKRTAVFLCMAGVVAIGTVMALRMSGRAMNNQVLDCVLTHELTHQHTESCYYTPKQEGAQKVLVCGMADFVVHKHDPEKCFDKMGNLICMLPEIEEHVHTAECYQEQKVLTCDLQEGEGGHVHSDNCYGPDRSAQLICGIEESLGHTHDKDCYDENGQLVCEQEESEGHTHTDSCYPQVLTCWMEAGDGGHVHSDSCYIMEPTVICGKREVQLHTHTEDCYLHDVDKLSEDQVQELAGKGVDVSNVTFVVSEEVPSEVNRVLDQSGAPILKCGRLQVLEHVHGDDCYIDVDTEGELVSQLGSGSEGAEMPGQRTAVYQGANMRVTAIYDGEDFPENARINVERVDEEGGLPEKQEQLNNAMPDEGLELMALLKVTVSGVDEVPALSEPIRLIVEPSQQGKVMAAAWYDSSEGLSEQGIYVQSEDPNLELLEVTEQENGGFAAEIYPGALVGVAQQPAVEEGGESTPAPAEDNNISAGQDADNVVLNISQSFKYEDDDYTMIFNVDGIARPKEGVEQPAETDTVPEGSELEQPEEDESESAIEGDPTDTETSEPENDTAAMTDDGNTVYFPETDQAEEDVEADAVDPTATDEYAAEASPTPMPTARPIFDIEPAETTVTVKGDVLPANVLDDPENPLGMLVERMAEDSVEYEMYADYAGEEDADSGLPGLKVMSYALYYKGIELDISECTVTLDITAKEKLVAAAAALEESQEVMAAEDTEAASVTMLTIVPVESTEEDTAEGEEKEVYSIPATRAMLDQVDLETKLLDIANENVSSDSPVKANAAIALGSQSETRTVRTVLRTAGQRSNSITVDKDHFGVDADTKDNPNFTVQYYAWLDVVNKHGTDLSVIDTTGGKLPQNGSGEKVSPNGNKLMGLNLVNKKVQTNSEWHKIFSEVSSRYIQRPNLEYFKPVGTENFYNLKQIWVLKDGKSAADATGADYSAANWDVYGLDDFGGATVPEANKITDFDHCHFTNKPKANVSEAEKYNPYKEGGNWYFPIKDGTVIRLIFEPTTANEPVKANFYDYDITDGTAEGPTKGTVGTSNYGINKYNFTTEYNSTDKRYAFGNNNAGTNYGEVNWDNNSLNMANAASYGKCTFDIVKGIDASGNIIFNTGIDGPNLFGTGDQKGRTVYGNSGLIFDRCGDTYTLVSAIVGNDTDNSLSSKSELNKFSSRFYHGWTKQDGHTQKCNDPNCRVVASNNFWPLDSIFNSDLHFGIDPDNQKFKNGEEVGSLPKNDDIGEEGSVNHNSYFGMNFSVTFDLTTEYCGPLEYLFFGDDDMWVFLTQVEVDDQGNVVNEKTETRQLICDIGGVHSSVGEYVNLWDYVGGKKTNFDKNPNYVTTKDDPEFHGIAHYKLDFFYTERGASGSTCWMQYTLPSVRSATSTQTEDELRRLEIKKEVTKTSVSGEFGTDNNEPEQYDDSKDVFVFKLTLRENGNPLKDNYSYFKIKNQGNNNQENEADTNGFDVDDLDAVLLDPDVVYNGAYFFLRHGESIVIDHLPKDTQFTIEECGVYSGNHIEGDKIIIDFKNGEHDYDISATIKQGEGGGQLMKPTENSEGHKVFSGTIQDNVSASVVMDNNFKTYELPKTGGMGTWGFTGAGALMVLAAGCLLARKRTKKN